MQIFYHQHVLILQQNTFLQILCPFLIFLRPSLSLMDTGAGPDGFFGAAGVVSVSDILYFLF